MKLTMVLYWTTVSQTLEHRYSPTTNFSFILSRPSGTVKTPLYRHLIITDSLLFPQGQKAVTFSLNSTG